MRHGSMFAALLLLIAATSPAVSTEVESGSCPITFPQGGIYGNEALQAVLPGGGKFVFRPGGAGFVDRDGALGIKFAWDRLMAGALSVGGRRLDGEAGPARAYMSNGYGDIGFQPIYLVFPTPGCWEITGRISEAKLTFILLVEKIGDGPSRRFEGLQRGWRQTN
jgi:hypothetical protein